MYWSVDENVVTRGSQEPNPVFPLGVMGQYFAISVFAATLQNRAAANNENQLYLLLRAIVRTR